MATLLGSDGRRPTHCPQCSTRVRGDVPWCLACYAPLADADRSTDQPARTEPTDTPALPADPAPDLEQSDLEQLDVRQVAARMLAELAAARDRPAWAERLPTTPAGRAALIAGLLTVVSTALLSAMALVGLAL
jgi:hypothetical protein